MEITWYGLSCFRLKERGLSAVVTDPFDHHVAGYNPLKLSADIITISHDAPGHNYLEGVKGNKHLVNGPGEYEIGGVFITGIQTSGDKKCDDNPRNILYVFDYDELTIAHLGDLCTVPSRAEVEALGDVDILLVPVGSGRGLNAAKAAEVVSVIDPRIVIPMHYATAEGKLKLEPLDKFIKEMGLSSVKAESSLKVTKTQLPEETQVLVLEAQV